MSGVAHLLKSLGDFQPVLADASPDKSADDSIIVVENLVQTEIAEEVKTPPTKKAKTITEGENWELLDAKSLVPHYESIEDAPDHLRKCEFRSLFYLLALVE